MKPIYYEKARALQQISHVIMISRNSKCKNLDRKVNERTYEISVETLIKNDFVRYAIISVMGQ